MAVELKVPSVGESVAEVEIGEWLKSKGEFVAKDEPVVTLESEKATVELPAPVSGIIADVMKNKGDTAAVGEVIGFIDKDGQPAVNAPKNSAQPAAAKASQAKTSSQPVGDVRVMPAAERMMAERGLKPEQIQASGPGGRILKEDVLRHPMPATEQDGQTSEAEKPSKPTAAGREEEVIPMTRLRRTVAERLVAAQKNAALLTTFNEVDMGAIMALRKEFGELFLQKYNTKLGFMSFFVKACVDALHQFSGVNAQIRENSIVYHNYCDIGVAIGGGK